MKWSWGPGTSEDLPQIQIDHLSARLAQADVEVVGDPGSADAWIVVISDRVEPAPRLANRERLGLVIDRRSSPAESDAISGLGTGIPVVAESLSVAVHHWLVGGRQVWMASFDSMPNPFTIVHQRAAVIVTGPWESARELKVSEAFKDDDREIVVTGPRRDVMQQLLGRETTRSVADIEAALLDRRGQLAVLLPGAAVCPDVAIAFGHSVVSETAPTLVDWPLVATVEGRQFAGRSAPALADVVRSDRLREWLTAAALGGISSRVRHTSLTTALTAAIEYAGAQQEVSSMIPGGGWSLLDATQLKSVLDTIRQRRS